MSSNSTSTATQASDFVILRIGFMVAIVFTPNAKGQRREPAAGEVRFIPGRNGWLPFAALARCFSC